MDGTTTTTSGEAGGERWVSGAPTTEQPQLVATAVGDQCANCGARLAGDQRYCVECGERRGKPRYRLAGGVPSGSAAVATAARPPPREPLVSRMSSSGALIGGVATLLLAMAVGLLIGLNVNNSTPARAPSVQYLNVPGAAAAPTTSTPSSGRGAAAKPSAKSSASKSTAKGTAAAIQAKLPPAARTIPKKLQSSVKKLGQKCASGPGCHGGTFNGQFFGGG